MVTKKSSKKKKVHKKKAVVKKPAKKKKVEKINTKHFPTLKLKTEHTIALDFGVKAVRKFKSIIKSVILFGSVAKKTQIDGSDIDILIIIDDVSIKWDQELIAWYREELDKLLSANPYKGMLHINTIKLSTWWEDLLRGEPAVINMLRRGEAIVDDSAFFNPLKNLLVRGKIKSSPEAIYTCLQRAPTHLARSKAAELMAIEGLYWAMVDSSHAALIASHHFPPSPEQLAGELKEAFVNTDKLKIKYVEWFRDLQIIHKQINHKKISDLKGVEIDMWQERTEEFMRVMIQLVKEIVKG